MFALSFFLLIAAFFLYLAVHPEPLLDEIPLLFPPSAVFILRAVFFATGMMGLAVGFVLGGIAPRELAPFWGFLSALGMATLFFFLGRSFWVRGFRWVLWMMRCPPPLSTCFEAP